MKVIYTDEARQNLDEILAYTVANYPNIQASFEKRLYIAVARIGAWPESAKEVAARPGVHVVPLVRYPYKIFYHVKNDAVEILYIHHEARRP